MNGPKLVSILENNGPKACKDISFNTPRRYPKVEEFNVQNEHFIRIAYLPSTHNKEEVVNCWIENNRSKIESTGARSIYINTPDEFREAMRDLLNFEAEFGTGGEKNSDKDKCSLCNEEYTGSLADHIRGDCEYSE